MLFEEFQPCFSSRLNRDFRGLPTVFFERRRPQSRLRIFTEWIVRKTLNSESGKAPKAHSPNLTPSGYSPRLLEQRLDLPMGAFSCAEIVGSKWCGKTWTAPSRSISVSRAKGKTERCPHVRARHRLSIRQPRARRCAWISRAARPTPRHHPLGFPRSTKGPSPC